METNQSSALPPASSRLISLRTALGMMVLSWFIFLIIALLGPGDALARWCIGYRARTEKTEWANHWFGIPIEQYPTDLMLYQELIQQIKPDVIIETGTDYGGNSLYLATVLDLVNDQGKVVTVDIDGTHFRETLAGLSVQGKEKLLKRIVFLEGSSTAPEIVSKVAGHLKPDSRVLVILDSAHSKEHVLEELKIYSAFVSPDSYIIVNDTQWGAPLDAVKEFIPTTDRFIIDHSLDKFTISCAHSGFLKRVK